MSKTEQQAKKKKKQYTAEELEQLTAAELERLLPEKQRLFIREWMVDHNGTQAAIRAGYRAGKSGHAAAVTASRLLKDPVIHACRIAMQKEAFRRLGISLESVCADLVEIKERCMQKRPVLVWDSDKRAYVESGEWQFDAKGATRACQELANLLGLKEKQDAAPVVRVELQEAERYSG